MDAISNRDFDEEEELQRQIINERVNEDEYESNQSRINEMKSDIDKKEAELNRKKTRLEEKKKDLEIYKDTETHVHIPSNSIHSCLIKL